MVSYDFLRPEFSWRRLWVTEVEVMGYELPNLDATLDILKIIKMHNADCINSSITITNAQRVLGTIYM